MGGTLTIVKCLLCEVKAELESKELTEEQQDKLYNITNQILPKNDEEEFMLIGKEMVQHMQAYHEPELRRIASFAAPWNGFNVMKYFATKDEESKFEKGKEEMRDKLLEEVMMFGPEDEDDEDDEIENDLTIDEEDDDLDEGEDEDDYEDEDPFAVNS